MLLNKSKSEHKTFFEVFFRLLILLWLVSPGEPFWHIEGYLSPSAHVPRSVTLSSLRAKREDYERRLPLLQRNLEEEASSIGGKGVGLERLHRLGYNIPQRTTLTVQEGFS